MIFTVTDVKTGEQWTSETSKKMDMDNLMSRLRDDTISETYGPEADSGAYRFARQSFYDPVTAKHADMEMHMRIRERGAG